MSANIYDEIKIGDFAINEVRSVDGNEYMMCGIVLNVFKGSSSSFYQLYVVFDGDSDDVNKWIGRKLNIVWPNQKWVVTK